MVHYNCSAEEMEKIIAKRDLIAQQEIVQGKYTPLKDYIPKTSSFIKV